MARVVRDSRLGELLFPATDEVMTRWIEAKGSWEVGEGWWLDHVLSPGMTFLNVGANIGYFTIWGAQLVGPRGRVIALEPDPANYALLRENLARRRLTTVTAYQAAASDAAGTVDLYVNPRNSGDHRVFDPGEDVSFGVGKARRIQVPALPADDLVAGEHVDVVMTDTQGWDHHVLRGLRRTIRESRPVVLCEFTPAWIKQLGEEPYDVLAEVVDQGYAVGVASLGVPAGRWELGQVVDYCSLPGLPYATLELTPLDVERTPRATPGLGFWRPESSGRIRRWWLTSETGQIHVQGPPRAELEVSFRLVAPPGALATVEIAGIRHVVQGGPVDVCVSVTLDPAGLADIQVTPTSGWIRAPGDPRRLFAAVIEPVVTAD